VCGDPKERERRRGEEKGRESDRYGRNERKWKV
jgi:hypothetical protein